MSGLILIEHKANGVAVVNQPNKNDFALALENHKIRNYPEEKKNANTAALVDKILLDLGANDKEGRAEQHLAAFKHINRTMGDYSYQEIQLAFDKYLNGEFLDASGKPVRAFAELNARVIGSVMAMYDNLKKQELNSYYRARAKEKQLADEEASKPSADESITMNVLSVLNSFENYKKDGFIGVGQSFVYDILYGWGLLPSHNKEFKTKVKIEAEKLVAKERAAAQLTDFKKIVKSAEQDSGALRVASKKVVLKIAYDGIEHIEILKIKIRTALKK
jgi:hypothetical protein